MIDTQILIEQEDSTHYVGDVEDFDLQTCAGRDALMDRIMYVVDQISTAEKSQGVK